MVKMSVHFAQRESGNRSKRISKGCFGSNLLVDCALVVAREPWRTVNSPPDCGLDAIRDRNGGLWACRMHRDKPVVLTGTRQADSRSKTGHDGSTCIFWTSSSFCDRARPGSSSTMSSVVRRVGLSSTSTASALRHESKRGFKHDLQLPIGRRAAAGAVCYAGVAGPGELGANHRERGTTLPICSGKSSRRYFERSMPDP
jgi:hypothetical protein